jgi:diguanylate cyclase (GGDEF)-like protein
VSSSLVLDDVLAAVAEHTGQAIDVTDVDIFEYDSATDTMIWRATWPEDTPGDDPDGPADGPGSVYGADDFNGDLAAIRRGSVLVETVSDPNIHPNSRRGLEMWGDKTTLTVPIIFGEEVLGTLELSENRTERVFTEEEIGLATALGEQAAVAIHNATMYRRQGEQMRRLASLLEASRAIASTVDIDEVLARVTREACQALDVSATTVYEYDEVGERFFYRAFHEMVADPRPDDPLGTSYLLSEYPGERFIFESDEVVIENLTDPELSPERREGMELWDERTILSVPMRVGGRRLGVLRFYVYEQPRRFSEGEIELAEGLGEQAAIAITNAHLYDRVERVRRRTDVLLNASRSLTTSLVPREVFDTITRRASEALGAPRASLYEYDQVADSLTARSFYEPVPTEGYYELDAPEPISDRPGDRAILAGDEIVVETMSDPNVDPVTRAEMELWNESTALNVPLTFRGETLGILMIIFTGDERRLTDDELALAAGLGEQAAVAMYNARLYDDTQRQKQRVDTLLETSQLLTSSLVLDEVVATMTQAAATALGAPRCDIYEYDKAADTLTLKGYYERIPSGMYGEIGEPQAMDERPGDRIILETGEIVAESVSDPSLDSATRAEMEEWGEKTCLNVPLIVKGERLGILIITETDDVREFSPAELDLARGLGEQVGMALQNARLYAHLETQNRRLLNLLQSSREMTGSMDVEKAVETMCSEMAGLLECPVCHIDVGLRSKSGSFVPAEVVAGDEELAANVEPILEPDELTEQALSERQPVQADMGEAGSRLVIPLLAKDEPSGFVEMSGPLGERFGRDKLEVVQILANQAAVAIDNARLYQDRERQAVTDGLTGLYNHRHFYERLTGEVARARRYEVPVALVMLDVDDFKGFNDTYGHQAGDEVLREIGRLLLSSIRQHIDVPARYGGEEFTVILPNTGLTGGRAAGERLTEHFAAGTVRTPESAEEKAGGIPAAPGAPVVDVDVPITEAVPASHPDGAVIVGERLRREVEAAVFRADDGSPLRKVTVSVGVASFPAHAASPDGLVEAADQALYAAKRAGKNRVEIWRKDET